LENPFAPSTDKRSIITHFERTKQQLEEMGYLADQEVRSLLPFSLTLRLSVSS
jgi:hypothetical protein